jgi:hypothetical protein
MLNINGTMGKNERESVRGSRWPRCLLHYACRHFRVIKVARDYRKTCAR